MIRYKNTHNGMILEVPDHYAPVYDRADNMQRLDPEPEPVATVDDLDSLTKRELREYAAENGIDLSGVRVVMNEDYEQGQSTSVKAGLSHVSPHADAAMFLLADQPLVDGRIIDALIAGFEDSRKPIVVPVSGGRRGNPVIIGRELFAELAASARGDAGARVLFGTHAGDMRCVELGTLCIHADVDTLEDYRRLLATAGDAPEDPSQIRSNDEVKDEHTGEA